MSLITELGRNALVRTIKPFFPLLVYVAVAGPLVLIFFSSFSQIETLILREKFNYLGAVAEEKVEEIAGWRAMQKRIGQSISRNSLLAGEFEQWLAGGTAADGRKQRLLERLGELRSVNGYRAVVLLDSRGKVRLSVPGKFVWGEEDAQLAGETMRSGEAQFSELHRNSAGDKSISIDLIAPLIVGGRIAGALVLQIDPGVSLYPLVQEQHFPSESGETLLVRQDGDDVLFLNELRHRKDSALALRVPLSSPKLPSSLAIRGELRTADGLDYRGVPVVAEMRSIPGSPWFVVSKIDRDELFGPVNQLRNWSTGIALISVVIGGVLVLLWLRGQKAQKLALQAQHAAAEERAMLLKHFEYLTRYANDIIVIADASGYIVEANERAETAYGYTREELLRLRIPDLRDTNEDPAVFAAQVEQLRAAGELRYETRSRRKDGTVFPVEVSARLITIEGLVYMQGIIRDISERKQAEEALRKSETLLNESQQLAHVGSWELDLVNNILYWSAENYRIFGVDPARGNSTYQDFLNAVHPDDRAMVNEAYTSSVQSRTPYNIVHRLQFSDRPLKYVREWCETIYDAAGRPLRSVGTTQDITEQHLAEEVVRESARLIDDLYNNAPCGYHSLDEDGVIVQINDTELQWLGYTRKEVVGRMNFQELLTPASRQLFRISFPHFKSRGFAHDVEYELIRRDGSRFHVLLSASVLYDADGKYLMSRTTLFDITERKHAEEELRLHGAILSQMDEGVILVRADSAEIVYVNPKFEQMFGYAPDEMLGMHVSNLNAPTAKSAQEEAEAIIAALHEQGSWEGEIYNRRKDGTPFWCHASTSTFEHHHYGTVWVSIHQDITERKQAEKWLLESEKRFRTMANRAPILLWMADGEYSQGYLGCSFFNQQWHDFTGLPPGRALNKGWLDSVHPDDRAQCLETYRMAFGRKHPFKHEYRLCRHDGEYRWMLDSGVPRFTDDGSFVGFIGTCIDNTSNKLYEEMREQMEHIGRLNIAGEMASGLAHELSQPVSAVNNYLDACLRRMTESDWDRELMQKTVRQAQAQAERAGNIINHLKTLVRKQKLKQKQERGMVDINEVISDSVSFLDYELQHNFIQLSLELSPLPLIPMNSLELEQVLLNLIKNAIEAMQSAPRRELYVATCLIGQEEVMVSVRDSGTGIATDELEKVFNPFFSSKQEGLGLGLVICRSLVENYGGRIWAEQNGDGGAEFNFTLPILGGL